MIKDIASNSNDVNQSSETLLNVAKRMFDGAASMPEKSQTVAIAAEEMSTNMTPVAAGSERMSKLSEQLNETVDQFVI